MDFGTILSTIIGVVATILIGYIGIKYSLKKSVTGILFIENNCIALFDTLTKNLDGLDINYEGKKVSENLIFLKGTFFNIGDVDIDKSIIYEPLQLKLPDNYQFVKAKIVEVSKGIQVNEKYDENILSFEWDLLKEGEYFTFECFIEYIPPIDNKLSPQSLTTPLWRNISFEHRIANMKGISKEKNITKPNSLYNYVSMWLMALLFIVGSFIIVSHEFVKQNYTLQYSFYEKNEKKEMAFKSATSTEIILEGDNREKNSFMHNDFLNKLSDSTIKIIFKKNEFSYGVVIVGILIILIFIAFIIGYAILDMRERRLYKKLKILLSK